MISVKHYKLSVRIKFEFYFSFVSAIKKERDIISTLYSRKELTAGRSARDPTHITRADLGVVRPGGSVEPPKLNVKTYNKRVVKKSEPTQLINISFENDISLCLCTRKQQ